MTWLRSAAGTAIWLRLLLVVLLPMAGLLFFGATASSDEQETLRAAKALRGEAELVGLLSDATHRLELEEDAIRSIDRAEAIGIEGSIIERDWQLADAGWIDNHARVDALIAEIEQVDRVRWVDLDSVDELIERWPKVESRQIGRIDLSPASGEARTIDLTATAARRAMDAQRSRLDDLLGRASVDRELLDAAGVFDRSSVLIDAARRERQAIADHLIGFAPEIDAPETDSPDVDGDVSGVGFRAAVGAAARFDAADEDLRSRLGPTGVDHMDRMEATDTWRTYESTRRDVLAGTAGDAVDRDAGPTTAEATVAHTDGFDRTQMLIDQHVGIVADLSELTVANEQGAERGLTLARLGAITLSTVALLAGLICARAIHRPVRNLIRRVEAVASGDLSATAPDIAPRDLRTAHSRLSEMSSDLRTVSDQAAALSIGRIDDEVFDETVTGPLGESVASSVAKLRAVNSELEFEAHHDPLTGLANRAALLSLLDRCLTVPEPERTPVALLMLDLDGFKDANDKLGRSVGDELLVRIAARLRDERRGAFVARLGGDEFMLVVTGDECVAKSRHISNAVLDAISRPIASTAGAISLSGSIGIVSTKAPEWLAPVEMLRRVGLALYEAKDDSGGTAVHFDQRLHDSLLATTQLQGEIRQAVERDEFDVYLQPIVELEGRRIVGFESLLRWDSPDRGPVSPDLFLPIAEQSDLITEVDQWVIERAAAVLGQWRHDPPLADKVLSVNASVRHLSHPDLVPRLSAALDRWGSRPEQLLIEVAESQLIPNLARAEDNLRNLGEIGVRLAIDDFGTGYASVAHLRRVSFDRVKIDQGFFSRLHDETSRSLTELLISVGREMDLDVVAEGIETEEQYEWAKQAGCTHAQGYLIGRPVAIKTPTETATPLRRRRATV